MAFMTEPEASQWTSGQTSGWLQGASSVLDGFPPRLLRAGPIDEAQPDQITGLPTVGGSFVGLLLAIARCTAFSALVARLDRDCFISRTNWGARRSLNVTASKLVPDWKGRTPPARARALARAACTETMMEWDTRSAACHSLVKRPTILHPTKLQLTSMPALDDTPIPDWRLTGDWWDLCNCAIGCPCNFGSNPTYGF